MSFYNTGNPVPSIDPRDLDDNAKHIDEIVNSSAPTFTDRLGAQRTTLAGVLVIAESVQASVNEAAAYADQAGIYADLAASFSNPYPTTADGLANTSGSGAVDRFFAVPGTGEVLFTLYRNDAGVPTQIGQVASLSAISALQSLIGSNAPDMYAVTLDDSSGRFALALKDDGTIYGYAAEFEELTAGKMAI